MHAGCDVGMSQASLLKVWVAQFLRVICGISYVVVTLKILDLFVFVHSYVVALSSRMSGFVLTNRSANIFGNIPFLRGQVYNICVTCEDRSLYMLILSQYLYTCVPATTPE